MTGAADSPPRRRRRPGAKAVAALVVIAGVGMPLAARVLGEMDTTAALVLPTVGFVVGICLLCPRQFMPELVVAAAYLGELIFLRIRGHGYAGSVVRPLLAGRLLLLAVPAGAIVLGHMATWVLRKRALWQWGGKSNLRLLLRRPGVLVRAYRWPLAAVLAGTTLDTVTTMRAMYLGGVSVELHPAMRAIAEDFGVTWGVPLASLVRLAFVFFVAAFWRRWCGWLLVVTGAGYALAVMSNHLGWL